MFGATGGGGLFGGASTSTAGGGLFGGTGAFGNTNPTSTNNTFGEIYMIFQPLSAGLYVFFRIWLIVVHFVWFCDVLSQLCYVF